MPPTPPPVVPTIVLHSESLSRTGAVRTLVALVQRELDYMTFRAQEADDAMRAWLVNQEVRPDIPSELLSEYRLNIIFGFISKEDAVRGLTLWLRQQYPARFNPTERIVHRVQWVGSHVKFQFFTGYEYKLPMELIARLLFQHAQPLPRAAALKMLETVIARQQTKVAIAQLRVKELFDPESTLPREEIANGAFRVITESLVLIQTAITVLTQLTNLPSTPESRHGARQGVSA